MIYLGGKNRLGKKIATIIEAYRTPNQRYLEPFVGGAGVTVHVQGERVAYDIDADIIAMWKSACAGWTPPIRVSEQEYKSAKENSDTPAHLRGFIKYACSWGGKPWGGYARGNREYARLSSEGVTKKAKQLQGVHFATCAYSDLLPRGFIIYCDPPYANVTGYSQKFDHEHFWQTIRAWSQENTVIISEYSAPDDFSAIETFPLRNKLNDTATTEKLWMKRNG